MDVPLKVQIGPIVYVCRLVALVVQFQLAMILNGLNPHDHVARGLVRGDLIEPSGLENRKKAEDMEIMALEQAGHLTLLILGPCLDE